MSIIYCEKHDRPWDSDKLEECPQCGDEKAEKDGNDMSQPFNEQATSLVEKSADLIKQVLIKHNTAVLEEMYEQITSRDATISELSEQVKLLRETNKAAQIKRQEAEKRAEKAEADLRFEHEHPFGLSSLLNKACAERDKLRDEAKERDLRINF